MCGSYLAKLNLLQDFWNKLEYFLREKQLVKNEMFGTKTATIMFCLQVSV